MASVEIPGKPRSWGNESTNFYQGSFMTRPGSASPLKSYRCYGHFYTNSGSLHVGAKVFNQKQPLDRYGTAAAHKLRMEDQRLPRPLASEEVHYRKLQDTSSVNLYQSHQHHYSQYSMPSGMRHRPHSAGPVISAGGNSIINSSLGPATLVPVIPKPTNPAQPVACANNHPKSLYDSLNRSFYITSYQKQISQPAASLNKDLNSGPSTSNLRPQSLTTVMVNPSRVPIRPLSASSRPQSFSSRSDFLKDIALKYPTPTPRPSNEKFQRPSSATLLRRGSIPQLRS